MTITASLLLATPALAQHANHQGMNHGNMAGMNHSMPATAANPYGPAEMKMHQKMMGAVGPNASETWVRKMIEHHRGGVETSRIAIARATDRSEEHTSELQSLMRISYAVFCLKNTNPSITKNY